MSRPEVTEITWELVQRVRRNIAPTTMRFKDSIDFRHAKGLEVRMENVQTALSKCAKNSDDSSFRLLEDVVRELYSYAVLIVGLSTDNLVNLFNNLGLDEQTLNQLNLSLEKLRQQIQSQLPDLTPSPNKPKHYLPPTNGHKVITSPPRYKLDANY